MQLNQHIDYTILKPTTLLSEVESLCSTAITNNYVAVCVPPLFVKKAKELTGASSVKVATVIGFPYGYNAIESKIAELLLAIVDGADELELVINIAALKNNDWQYLANELNHVMQIIAAKNKTIKIIMETGLLTNDEIIKCCDLYGVAGVQFIQLSTGTINDHDSLETIALVRKHLANSVQIKAITNSLDQTVLTTLLDAGANRFGYQLI